MAALALTAVAVFAMVSPVVGQRDVGRVVPDRLSDRLAGWLAANVPEGGRVVMAFRERDAMALRRFGAADVALLPLVRVRATDRSRTTSGSACATASCSAISGLPGRRALTQPPVDELVLVGPHPFTPTELVASPGTAEQLGLTHVTALDEGPDRVDIYRVDATAATAGTPDVPAHLSVEAAEAWLDLVGSDGGARLLAARPVVTGDDVAIRELVRRLGGRRVCHPWIGFRPPRAAGSCPD